MEVGREIINKFKKWKDSEGSLPSYWTSEATAEVEFVIQWGEEIIPVEVKAEGNISGNSLSVYAKRYEPCWRLRSSMLNLQNNCGLLSLPSPLIAWFDKMFELAGKESMHG